GMDYLSRMGHVHRDLATRNCLVGDQQIVKIADFASLQRQYDRDYYHIASRSRVPLRWLSKEALHESRYSSASDVYAFGVTLWEIYTYGRQPYSEFSNQEVIKMIGMHDLLPSPPNCPSNIYSVMIECWNETSERRPTFGELHTKFQKWCLAGPSQFFITTNRANSSHSGGSNGRRQGSSNPSLTRNFINDPYSVPPPAPVHSTPIGQSYLAPTNNSRSPKGKRELNGDSTPLMKHGQRGNYVYSEESSEDD
uniref:Protein kinase domain-containing protein n=1 Tax=Panagrolaimus sp. JU765 TaxID=591449 RepID=A0AC34QWH4_9BILA